MNPALNLGPHERLSRPFSTLFRIISQDAAEVGFWELPSETSELRYCNILTAFSKTELTLGADAERKGPEPPTDLDHD